MHTLSAQAKSNKAGDFLTERSYELIEARNAYAAICSEVFAAQQGFERVVAAKAILDAAQLAADNASRRFVSALTEQFGA